MIARCAMLLLLLAVAGCGSSPKTRFYTLNTVPVAGAITYAPVNARLEVGHVMLPATLDRQSMVRQGPGDQLDISDRDRWAAPLDELTRRVLTGDLRHRLPPRTMLAPGDPTLPGMRTLMVNVQRFMADASGHVILEADWSIEQHGRTLAPRHEVIRVPMSGQDGQEIADAMSRALGELADRIASRA
jgi:uncharacterized lipoprotein YmbA